MQIFIKIVKWITLLFLILVILSFTIFQNTPIEIANMHWQQYYYRFLLEGLPIMVILTLIWTLKKSNSRKQNLLIVILTTAMSIAISFYSLFLTFRFGFGTWINYNIAYENKSNPTQTINEQIYDVGAFGYGGKRTVKLTPFFKYWNKVKHVDTLSIDHKKWKRVDKESDIKFP